MENNGRPTVMTPETITKLEEAFSIGATDKEAIFLADIGSSTFYEYCQAHPEFAERKEALKDMPKYAARKNITKAINEGDKQISSWYLERKAKEEFSSRTEQTGKDGKDLMATEDTEKIESLTQQLNELRRHTAGS